MVAGALALALAQGIASEIGSEIAGALIGEVLGGEPPAYFDHVYDEIRHIVADELDRRDREQMTAAFHDTSIWINDTYLPRKTSATGLDTHLRDMLDEETRKIQAKVDLLMEPRYRLAGLGPFLLGAGIHLALLQEIYDVRGRAGAQAETFHRTVGRYITHATETWETLLARRRGLVKIGTRETWHRGGVRHRWWWVEDGALPEGVNGHRRVTHELSDKSVVERVHGEYDEFITLHTEAGLGYPPAIVDNWKLAAKRESPLPGKGDRSAGPRYPLLDRATPVERQGYVDRLGSAYRLSMQQHSEGNWKDDGPAGFAAFTSQEPGTVPVYPFVSNDSGRWYWYDRNARSHPGWTRRDPVFFAFAKSQKGTVPIYEYKSHDGWYYYTAFPGGDAYWRERWTENKRVVFHAFPSPRPNWHG